MIIKLNSFPYKVGNPARARICDFCLQESSEIYNTKKLGITKHFKSDICPSCIKFQLQAYNESRKRKESE